VHELRLQPKLFNTITGRARPGVRNSLCRPWFWPPWWRNAGFRGRDSTSGEIGGAPLCRRWQFRAGAGSSVQAESFRAGADSSVQARPQDRHAGIGLCGHRHRRARIRHRDSWPADAAPACLRILAGATAGPDYLKVPYPKSLVRDAPWISPDGVLPASGEEAVFRHYDLSYQTGAGGERRLARR